MLFQRLQKVYSGTIQLKERKRERKTDIEREIYSLENKNGLNG